MAVGILNGCGSCSCCCAQWQVCIGWYVSTAHILWRLKNWRCQFYLSHEHHRGPDLCSSCRFLCLFSLILACSSFLLQVSSPESGSHRVGKGKDQIGERNHLEKEGHYSKPNDKLAIFGFSGRNTYEMYAPRFWSMKACCVLFDHPFNWKYLACAAGPILFPCRMIKATVPTIGIKFKGR